MRITIQIKKGKEPSFINTKSVCTNLILLETILEIKNRINIKELKVWGIK